MKAICLYFQVHQPFRFKKYRFFDIGNNHYYYDDFANKNNLKKLAERSYLPANKLIFELISEFGKDFKVSFSISGTTIEQFRLFAPEVLESFRKLAATGSVEFISETYSHSLASLFKKELFYEQVKKHSETMENVLGVKPVSFRNTELIYSDQIGADIAELGYKIMLTEGSKEILGWKSPNYLYCNSINPKLKVLLRNFRLSDDITLRFSDSSWNEWPLTTEKLASWINILNEREEIINIFFDYNTFGEHHKAESGIFEFLHHLPETFLKNNFTFLTPAEIAEQFQPVSAINVPNPISWADEERDIAAWLGNDLQKEAFNKLFNLHQQIKNIEDDSILSDWYFLLNSDHFHYMSTKWFSDLSLRKSYNPYQTPYDAFINYMNIISDFTNRVNAAHSVHVKSSSSISEIENLIKEYQKQLKKLKTEQKQTFVK